ncbi:Male sterility NAD-binding [Penicillium cf. griseofulvum]|nr:Male sterility NAD-binding [Penicillium cf. griseofulvum]
MIARQAAIRRQRIDPIATSGGRKSPVMYLFAGAIHHVLVICLGLVLFSARDLTGQETQDHGDIRQIRSVLDGHGAQRSKQTVPLLVLAWALLLKEYNRSETLLLSVCENERFLAQIPFESHPASSIELALEQAAEFLTFPSDPVKSEIHAAGNDQYTPHVTLSIMDCRYQHPKTRGSFQLHPQEGLRLTGSAVVLTSKTEYDRLARVKGVDRIVVSEATLRSLPRPSASWQFPSGDKEDVACVLFTSGSTGQPKGVLLSHRAIATTIHHHGLATGIDKPPRTLQFSSYAFDMAIYEIFHALVRGGTVYTPSEEERLHDLPSFVTKHRTTWAFITPAMLRTCSPSQFPTMDTIVVGGEAVGNDLVQTWGSRLYNGFGPAEVSICVSTRMDPRSWVDGTIGRPVGCIGWIVNPNDMNILTPIGGELLVEGPIVAHGYFNEPEKTEQVFLSAPSWRSTFPIPHRGAFFRTSDLVQFNWDGSMRYLGRRDTVRKINGQRIDIENIEFTLRQMETNLDISVDVLTSPGAHHQDIVIAFVAERSTKTDILNVSSGRENAIRDEMGHRLPRYMIPAFVIELSALPKTPTSKIDRKKLAAMFTGRTESEITKLLKSKTNGNPKRIAMSAVEHQVASLVQETLGLDATDIDVNSAFVHIGGDSLAAVRLVSLARKSGMSLKAMDLLQHDLKLSDLAQGLEKCEPTPSSDVGSTVVPPFSILPENSDDRTRILEAAQEQCDIGEESIRDIYPCTPIQEGLFSTTSIGSRAYIDQFTLTLSPEVDRSRLVRAWNTVIRSSDILRTRIIQTSVGVYQVVTDHHEAPMPSFKSEEQYLTSDAAKEMGPGTPLVVLGLIVPETHSITEKNNIATPKAQLV